MPFQLKILCLRYSKQTTRWGTHGPAKILRCGEEAYAFSIFRKREKKGKGDILVVLFT